MYRPPVVVGCGSVSSSCSFRFVGGVITLGVCYSLPKCCVRKRQRCLFAVSRALANAAFCASLAMRGGLTFTHAFGMM